MKKLAIVSVYDKTGLEPFVRGLVALGYGILSTGGTAKFLADLDIPIIPIDDYTKQPEILGGRVKTLHPRIHGGILARRDVTDDLEQLAKQEISPIDIVAVNLYPFTDKVAEVEASGRAGQDSLVEYIDIGGPTMIRAAAKNWKHVVPICDPRDYEVVLKEMSGGGPSLETRQKLAAKVFMTMAAYDASVARYFSLNERLLDESGTPRSLAPFEAMVLEQKMGLRYGENPHQHAGLYRKFEVSRAERAADWEVLQGKELSYNNLLDMHAALDLFLELYERRGTDVPAVIIKHSNPCGAAMSRTPLESFVQARECDPVSAFGGIVVLGGRVDAALAEEVVANFVEVVVVDTIDSDAIEVFAKKKNVRLVRCSFDEYLERRKKGGLTIRNFFGDYLVQTVDNKLADPRTAQVVTKGQPGSDMLADLVFAWSICKHVKSNTIVISKKQRAIGIGAGQMSRVDAARIAIERAKNHGHSLIGAVAASDAFLPFPDTLEILGAAGIQALIQPGGSIKDPDVIARADDLGVVMLFTGERHFRH